MPDARNITRRAAIQRGLIFSAAFMAPRFLLGQETNPPVSKDALHLFCFGDWGVRADANQVAVAKALQDYAAKSAVTPHALMLLGDNFYGPNPSVDSPRWKTEFEDMYPPSVFPGPCYAILGNHDYDDQPGGERIQLDYAKQKEGTRWKMPDRWYRLDLPSVTVLCVDTHFPKLSPEDITAQQKWLEEQLALPRTTPWLIVCGHHPVLSVGAHHGGTPWLQHWRDLFHRSGVHAYVCGHEHDLQHIHEKDQPTDWIISGGGGKSLHKLDKTLPSEFAEETFGFLHLSFTVDSMSGVFIGTDAAPLHSFRRSNSPI